MAGGNSKIVKEQSGFRAGHFTIRKKRTLAPKRFLNVSVQTQTKLPMVTWADILCLLHLLYNVSNTGYELQIYQTKGLPPPPPPPPPPTKAYNMLLYLQDLGKKTWAYQVLCQRTAMQISKTMYRCLSCHTLQLLLMFSYVMSADDDRTIWKMSRFCITLCKGKTTL